MSRRQRKQARRLAILGILIPLGLSGCGTSTVVSDYCTIYEPIFFDDRDTEGTISQVTRENGKFECICHQDCPNTEG